MGGALSFRGLGRRHATGRLAYGRHTVPVVRGVGYNTDMSQLAIHHIESTPDICDGRPCIGGTRIRVQDVYVWHELQGQSTEEIVTSFPQLSLAGVHAALSYYYDHRDEIENAAKAERVAADQARATHASKLLSKLNGPDGNPAAVPS
jgi:uncharacterized protein (DUF433 family)